MTRRDALALIRALQDRGPERPTVELIRNARGVNIGVKVSARTVKEAGKKAEAEFNRLSQLYRGANATTTDDDLNKLLRESVREMGHK